jgi:hypothetical protein
MPDYQLPLSLPGPGTLGLATAIVGIVGTLAVFALGLVLARVFTRGAGPGFVSREAAPDAA